MLGGFAANLRGSPITTRDLDVIPDRARENLDRLGRALTRMNAMIRISGEPVPTKIDGVDTAKRVRRVLLHSVQDEKLRECWLFDEDQRFIDSMWSQEG